MNRTAWGSQFRFCMWPDCRKNSFLGNGLETHELIGGPMRAAALGEPAAWLRVCEKHHRDLPSVPNQQQLLTQLALKRHYDPDSYDLIAVLKLWRPNRRGGYMDGPITEAEVEAEEKRLFG